MKKPYVLILAGGSGTRLWPMSRNALPKQLLPVTGKKTLIEETLDRALLLTDRKHIFIGTNAALKKKMKKKTGKVNYLVEPAARNTAPIIALFCAEIARKKPDSDVPVVVLSADHYIAPAENWARSVQKTFPYADNKIWCMGIKPTRPDTGYGYIEGGESYSDNDMFLIKSFREKPDEKTASDYVTRSEFSWNSGMFIFSVRLFRNELKQHAPEILALSDLAVKSKKNLKKYFPDMPDISVDYAVLEKSANTAVIQADFIWDDVGSFPSFARILKADTSDNYAAAETAVVSVSSKGNIVLSGKKVALLGVNNLVIIDTKDVLMIADRSQIDKIKDLRSLLPENH